MSTTEVIIPVKPLQPVVEEKEALVKKPKSAKNASHPPYFEMIKDALLALKAKECSSPHAIAKYIEERQKGALPANFRKILRLQLRSFAAKGKLIKVKASYKLSELGKKDNKVPKAVVAKKKVEKVKETVVAAVAVKPEKKSKAVKKPKKGAKGTAAGVDVAGTPVKKPAAKAKAKSIKSPVKKALRIAASVD